ncbi:aminotransferase class IV family protein [Microbacterium betulae]|uniref:Aminotransferase class IV family protein n=1 Tax=Microbacterium betulae TaxID=2981139 RepID=A0AA97I3S7_9MICO|nr:aminotransferase class IV family protein [Microbacterium sp. AB]WOF21796.1 aminotransferase class IV family protein [Microbacterium sp. AB]
MQQLDGAAVGIDRLQALALVNHGHFTTMRVDGGRVRGLSRHLERLVRDCRTVFDAELDVDAVRGFVRAAIADEDESVVVRVTVFDPALGLQRPGGDAAPRVLVSPRGVAPSADAPLRLRTTRYQRDLPAVKHTGLFGALHERRRAQRAGFDDAVFVDATGRLSEGPTWNLGFVDGGRLVWPEADALPGVTMSLLSEAHDGLVTRRPVSASDLPGMEAAFATNAGGGVRAVAAIDDVTWDPAHPAIGLLRDAYASIAGEPLIEAPRILPA